MLGGGAEFVAGGGEVVADEARLRAHLLQAIGPELGAAAEPFEYAGDFLRDASLALAKQATGVVNKQEIAAERETFQHPFARSTERARVLHGAEPVRFLELACGATPGDRTTRRLFDRCELPFLLRVLHALTHRSVTTCLRRGRNASLRIVTGHDVAGFAEQDWRGMARTGEVAGSLLTTAPAEPVITPVLFTNGLPGGVIIAPGAAPKPCSSSVGLGTVRSAGPGSYGRAGFEGDRVFGSTCQFGVVGDGDGETEGVGLGDESGVGPKPDEPLPPGTYVGDPYDGDGVMYVPPDGATG